MRFGNNAKMKELVYRQFFLYCEVMFAIDGDHQ